MQRGRRKITRRESWAHLEEAEKDGIRKGMEETEGIIDVVPVRRNRREWGSAPPRAEVDGRGGMTPLTAPPRLRKRRGGHALESGMGTDGMDTAPLDGEPDLAPEDGQQLRRNLALIFQDPDFST